MPLSTVTPESGRQARGFSPKPWATWVAQSVLAAIAAYVAMSSRSLGIWSDGGPGPGFFPLVLSIALLVLCVVWFLQTRVEAEPSAASESTLGRQAAITTVSLVLLAAVLDLIGFQLAMFLFLLFHLRVLGRVRWVTSLVVALVGSVGAFHLFSDLLLVPLPLATLPALAWIGV